MCAWSVCGSVCQDQDQPPVQRSAVARLWTELRSRQSWSVSCSHAWPCRIVLAPGMPAARFKWIRGARSEATEREGTVGSFHSRGDCWKLKCSAHYGNDSTDFVGIFLDLLCVIAPFLTIFYWFAPAVKLWGSYLVTSQSTMSPCLVSFYKTAFKNNKQLYLQLPYYFLVVKNVRSMWCWHL